MKLAVLGVTAPEGAARPRTLFRCQISCSRRADPRPGSSPARTTTSPAAYGRKSEPVERKALRRGAEHLTLGPGRSRYSRASGARNYAPAPMAGRCACTDMAFSRASGVAKCTRLAKEKFVRRIQCRSLPVFTKGPRPAAPKPSVTRAPARRRRPRRATAAPPRTEAARRSVVVALDLRGRRLQMRTPA